MPGAPTAQQLATLNGPKTKGQKTTAKTYATGLKYWDKFASQYSDTSVKRLVNDTGLIPQQTINTAIQYALWLKKQDGMTYSIIKNCLNSLQRELTRQRSLHNKPKEYAFFRRIEAVKEVEACIVS